MEQIRQILSQLALHLELNIAMCDKIEQLEKRLDKLEPSHDAQKTRLDALSRRVSEMAYTQSSRAYEDRISSMKGKK